MAAGDAVAQRAANELWERCPRSSIGAFWGAVDIDPETLMNRAPVGWLVAAAVAPVVLVVLGTAIGFGAGTLCTNHGNGSGLATPPCSRIDVVTKLNAIVQAACFVWAALTGWHFAHRTWHTFLALAASIGMFAALVVGAASAS